MTGHAKRRRRPDGPNLVEFAQCIEPLITLPVRRALLIANDLRVTESTIMSLSISADDLVIQFNDSLPHNLLRDYVCYKSYAFNRHANGNWGFDECGRLKKNLLDQGYQSLFLLFPEGINLSEDQYIRSALPSIHKIVFFPCEDLQLFPYPLGYKMSAGFAVLCLLRLVNWLRQMRGVTAFDLFLVGFTGEYTDRGRVIGGWGVHDFSFEQRCYSFWEDVVRIGFDGRVSISKPSATKDDSGDDR